MVDVVKFANNKKELDNVIHNMLVGDKIGVNFKHGSKILIIHTTHHDVIIRVDGVDFCLSLNEQLTELLDTLIK